ncbi:MAG: hypothetical protein Q9M28_09015 [Mariprofundaceae bacterium]|nr:hypothetical protein [Mariprofundaceae bacterium]
MATRPMQFSKSCLKTLTAVEADVNRSNQHEFQGVAALRSIFGNNRISQKAQFSIRGNDTSYPVGLTWYDARENNPERSAEFRLYFQSNSVMKIAQENDSIIIGLDQNNTIYCELIPQASPEYIYSNGWSVK